MANQETLHILKRGVGVWNRWREQNRELDLFQLDLTKADLKGADLRDADLREAWLSNANLQGVRTLEGRTSDGQTYGGANLSEVILCGADLRQAIVGEANLSKAIIGGADLSGAELREADLTKVLPSVAAFSKADFSREDIRQAIYGDVAVWSLTEHGGVNTIGPKMKGASLVGANLTDAHLQRADLREADLNGVNLTGADLSEADLSGAILVSTHLVETKLFRAKLSGCRVYGISAWNTDLHLAEQSNLIITRDIEPSITVDNLEVAQFIYLLLTNEKVRDIIDTVTSKAVLILGRFTEERKAVLDAIREELRRRDYLPILFDFNPPASKDTTGTVETLARMARFIVADLTDPSSIPHELATITPFLRTTPVLPIRLAGSRGYSLFEDYQRAFPWILDTHVYKDDQSLISALPQIIAPADKMADKFRNPKYIQGDETE